MGKKRRKIDVLPIPGSRPSAAANDANAEMADDDPGDKDDGEPASKYKSKRNKAASQQFNI